VRPDSGTIAFGYDSAGRPSSVRFDRGTLAYGYSSTTGNLAAIRAPSGDSLAFSYDGAVPTGARWTGAVTGSIEVSHDSDLRVSGQTVNGGDAVSFVYDADGLRVGVGALVLSRSPLNGLLSRIRSA